MGKNYILKCINIEIKSLYLQNNKYKQKNNNLSFKIYKWREKRTHTIEIQKEKTYSFKKIYIYIERDREMERTYIFPKYLNIDGKKISTKSIKCKILTSSKCTSLRLSGKRVDKNNSFKVSKEIKMKTGNTETKTKISQEDIKRRLFKFRNPVELLISYFLSKMVLISHQKCFCWVYNVL